MHAGQSPRKVHLTKNLSKSPRTARVRNEFLVPKEKRWYHLEMIKLVFKGSREADPTTTRSLCLPPPANPQEPGHLLAGGVWLLAALFFGSAINTFQTNLAASLQKSLPFLPFWALSPQSVKQKMFRKPSSLGNPFWNQKVSWVHIPLRKTQRHKPLVHTLSGTLGTVPSPLTSPSSHSTN